MSMLTKKQWDEVKVKLSIFYNPVILDCDGYEVCLKLVHASQFKNEISVYVNGYIKGTWMIIKNNTEEGRRFFPTVRKSVWSKKEKNDLIAIFGRGKKGKNKRFDNLFETRRLQWQSFGALKKHFVDNNKSIKWKNSDA